MISFFRKFNQNSKGHLIEILEDSKKLLELPDSDYAWSSWENQEEAINEIDGFITRIRAGKRFSVSGLEIIFSATGPMQEVSLSSGWGEEFLKLSERFDKAISDKQAL